MPQIRAHATVLASQLDILRENELSDPIALMIDEAQRSPAWPTIAEGFVFLARAGLGRTDPEVVRSVIERGEFLHREVYGPIDKSPIKSPTAHETLIYYFQLGDLVKIGISRNLTARVDALNPQAILAIERGTFADEVARHKQFASLHVHGEWFRNEDPLTAYVDAVAEAFEHDFEQPLKLWLTTRGLPART